jgi:hypothetical protein
LGTPFKFFTDYFTLKYLVNKPVFGGRICRWLLLFQEFEFEVVFKIGKYNVGLDHLSRIDPGEASQILDDEILDAQLFPWKQFSINWPRSLNFSCQTGSDGVYSPNIFNW